MQEIVIHQNIERKLQCIFIGTLGMKERKEKQILKKKIIYLFFNFNNGNIYLSIFLKELLKSRLFEERTNLNVFENCIMNNFTN
jgi:hypothetical protein